MSVFHRRGRAVVDALRPAQGEFVVITIVGARVAAIDHVRDYSKAIMRALELAEDQPEAVKVRPMTFTEACFFCRITPEQFMADISDEELRERTIAACLPMLDHPSARERRAARELLEHWGAVQ
jgi:hypothetical protein